MSFDRSEFTRLKNLKLVQEGFKWCTKCKDSHPLEEFGKDSSRWDGLSAKCLKSSRVLVKKDMKGVPRGLRGWVLPARDGDKKQARRRVNYLVEQKRIPKPNDLPCVDCGHIMGTDKVPRHEYDHPKGYGSKEQLTVDAVCSPCHHKREADRKWEIKLK